MIKNRIETKKLSKSITNNLKSVKKIKIFRGKKNLKRINKYKDQKNNIIIMNSIIKLKNLLIGKDKE